MSDTVVQQLERAWNWRMNQGILRDLLAARVFHGPGEGSGPLSRVAVEKFGEHFWITHWGQDKDSDTPIQLLQQVARFYQSKGARSVVTLTRPERGVPEEARALEGEPPADGFEVLEETARFKIRLLATRHPGLFLDHLPLRRWLRARASGWSVLNTFSYTGSLSVAAGLGGATHVTTLDLSKATIQWAQENWRLNGLSDERARFVAGDVFEWLPRLKREGKFFDCVILDPPSFSHGKKGNFSTAKDLKKLHALALDLIPDGGVLATSINSANIPWKKFEGDVGAAAKEKGVSLQVLWQIDLPETFPTRLGRDEDRYLKGWVLRVNRSRS